MSLSPAVFHFLAQKVGPGLGFFLGGVGGVAKWAKSMRKARLMELRRPKEHVVDISWGCSPTHHAPDTQGGPKSYVSVLLRMKPAIAFAEWQKQSNTRK